MRASCFFLPFSFLSAASSLLAGCMAHKRSAPCMSCMAHKRSAPCMSCMAHKRSAPCMSCMAHKRSAPCMSCMLSLSLWRWVLQHSFACCVCLTPTKRMQAIDAERERLFALWVNTYVLIVSSSFAWCFSPLLLLLSTVQPTTTSRGERKAAGSQPPFSSLALHREKPELRGQAAPPLVLFMPHIHTQTSFSSSSSSMLMFSLHKMYSLLLACRHTHPRAGGNEQAEARTDAGKTRGKRTHC